MLLPTAGSKLGHLKIFFHKLVLDLFGIESLVHFSLGKPPVPTVSCVDLFEYDSGGVNVIVSWTLSGGDSTDFYLMNITTNAP